MQLGMLGGLELSPAASCGHKPLLLLAYLALEGRQERRHVAELFWPDAAVPLASLSVALSSLRRHIGPELTTDTSHVATTVHTDVADFRAALDRSDVSAAARIHKGAFLAGVRLDGLRAELEEWQLHIRESLAGRLRAGLLRQAELAGAAGAFSDAGQLATRALHVAGVGPPGSDELRRLHRLLLAAGLQEESRLRAEAAELALPLTRTAAAARAQLGRAVPIEPAPASRLFGREQELSRARAVLAGGKRRILSVIGPAGIGKSSLVEWLAAEFRGQQDVAFVALEAVAESRLLPGAICRATGLQATDDWNVLVRQLQARELLLVLDGYEHLSGEARLLDLLAACPGLRILVSSRRQLQLPGQVTIELAGLSVPVESLEDAPAVQLFVSAARHSRPDFDPSLASLAAIARIAETLAGSPLAIMLAASWTRLMPVTAIARQLEADLGLLDDAATAAGEDLEKVLSSSLALLDAAEKRLLLRLAVFRGGFTAEAAMAVAGATRQSLSGLVAKSMLSRVSDARFGQHELLQSFMRRQLAADSMLAEATRHAHADWFLSLVRDAGSSVHGLSKDAAQQLTADYRNILQAWHYAVEAGETTLLEGCPLPFGTFCDGAAHAREGADLLRLTSAGLQAGCRLHAEVGLALAWLKLRLGQLSEAGTLAGQVAAAAADDGRLGTWAATVQATVAYRLGDYGVSEREFRRLLELAGDARTEAFAHGRLGVVLQAAGDYPAAREHYGAALTALRELGEESAQVSQLLNLGALEMNSGAAGRASELLTEGLELARRTGNRQIVPVLLHNLANLASKQQEHVEARRLIVEALELVRNSGEQTLETGMLATLSYISLRAGQVEEAERQALAALELANLIGDDPAALTALLRYAEVRREHSGDVAQLLQRIANDPATLAWTARRASHLLETEPKPPVSGTAVWPPEVQHLLQRKTITPRLKPSV